jgi:SAM-dependent methyltransferase
MIGFYAADLAAVHDAGFSGYARAMAPELVRLLRLHRIRSGPIVEFGCGGGALAACLVRAGYEVEGVDISPAQIRIARRRAPGARFRVGSLARSPIPPCRAVVAIGEVISYLDPLARPSAAAVERHDAAVRAFFARVAQRLPRGGLLVFDFVERAEGRTYARRRISGPGWRLVLRATVDDAHTCLTRTMTIARIAGGRERTSREVHHVRLGSRAAMRAALREAGFAVRFTRRLGSVELIRGNVLAVCARG